MSHLIRFDIDSQKGIAFLETLLDKVGGEYNYMALLKLAFFADRYHIRNYARPIVGDIYYALKLGPLPSNLRDIIDVQVFSDANIVRSNKDFYTIRLKSNKIDMTAFSKSDLEAIDFSIEYFSKIGKDQYKIANLTHAYPEWERYKNQFLGIGINSRFEMDYADFLKNAHPNHIEFQKLQFRDPFIPLTESEREDITAELREMSLLYG